MLQCRTDICIQLHVGGAKPQGDRVQVRSKRLGDCVALCDDVLSGQKQEWEEPASSVQAYDRPKTLLLRRVPKCERVVKHYPGSHGPSCIAKELDINANEKAIGVMALVKNVNHRETSCCKKGRFHVSQAYQPFGGSQHLFQATVGSVDGFYSLGKNKSTGKASGSSS